MMPNSTQKLRLATRGSPLAIAQSQWVADQLVSERPDLSVELVTVKTQGDMILDRPLREIGGKALFTKGVEQALLDGRCDMAVHSLKDMDSVEPTGLVTVAFPQRHDPRDVMVTKAGVNLDHLSPSARVGTGGLRRVAQLRTISDQFQLMPLRGNINSRLARLDADEFDAIVLAAAGLKRAGLEARIGGGMLDTIRMLPAPGQGILSVQMHEDHPLAQIVGDALDHIPTRQTAMAERAFLAELNGNCHSPIAAYCQLEGDGLSASLAVFIAPTALGENTPLMDKSLLNQIWRAEHRFTVKGSEDLQVFAEAGRYAGQQARREASAILLDWQSR